MKIVILFSILALGLSFSCAYAKCESPEKVLIQYAAKDGNHISDFSKSTVSSGMSNFERGGEEFYLVQALSKTEQVNGVLICDKVKNSFVVLSYSWYGPKGNGISGGQR